IDLGVLNRTPHVIKTKEALIWTCVWLLVAAGIAGFIFWIFQEGWVDNPTQLSTKSAVVKYVTGYLVELSLSIDNVFVMAVIFSSFAIPRKYQHEVLFYGILGAVVFRALMILFGVALINRFSWIVYVFGAFLIYTALKMLFKKDEEIDPKSSLMFRWTKKIFPVSHHFQEGKFFIKRMGIRAATPLFIALIVIELSDILFALDSIPAILSITQNPFIVFSSNILAILGLRSMYFLISGMLAKFRFIDYSLAVILSFVGIKMILTDYYSFSEWLTL